MSENADEPDPAYVLLAALGAELAAGGVGARAVEGAAGVPAQLVVTLEVGRGWVPVHLMFLPGHQDPPVLQYFVPLELAVEPPSYDVVARTLHLVNTQLPLTGFEMSEAAGAVVFRYLQPIGVHPLDPTLVVWPLTMILHALGHYLPLVREAAEGAALEEVAARHAEVVAGLLT